MLVSLLVNPGAKRLNTLFSSFAPNEASRNEMLRQSYKCQRLIGWVVQDEPVNNKKRRKQDWARKASVCRGRSDKVSTNREQRLFIRARAFLHQPQLGKNGYLLMPQKSIVLLKCFGQSKNSIAGLCHLTLLPTNEQEVLG